MFIWYRCEDYHSYVDAVAVSFEFFILEYDHNGYATKCSNDKFENCGVQMLYLQDAMEFDIDSNPYPFQVYNLMGQNQVFKWKWEC